MLIRPRQDDDVPGLVEVLRRVHEADGYPVNLPPDAGAWLCGERVRASWVATLDGRLVGQVSRAVVTGDNAAAIWLDAVGCTPEELAVVKRLFVDPGVTGRGIGRRLLDAVVEDAHRLGLRPVLDVDAGGARGRFLYESAGWQLVGVSDLPWSTGGVFPVACYVGPPPRVGAEPD